MGVLLMVHVEPPTPLRLFAFGATPGPRLGTN
jgi:hypothetical protein